MNDLITAHFPFHEIKELNIIFLTVYILDDMKPVFDICLKSNALYILCMYACSILACRGVGSYLKLGGQVVMWEAQSAPSGWYRVNWSAKTSVGNCPFCPPIFYAPDLPRLAWSTYNNALCFLVCFYSGQCSFFEDTTPDDQSTYVLMDKTFLCKSKTLIFCFTY